MEDRKAVVAEYFKVKLSIIESIAVIPYGEERKEICKKHNVDPYVFRTMIDYDRYREARLIHTQLEIFIEKICELNITDFGCLVSDYGIYFARLGARVTAYDKSEVLKFTSYRYKRENLSATFVPIPADYYLLTKNKDVMIFGEVLEHLDDPLNVLKNCITNGTRYIFTSRYPFGGDFYFSRPGHRKTAQDQQPECIALLRENYREITLRKETRLWRRER